MNHNTIVVDVALQPIFRATYGNTLSLITADQWIAAMDQIQNADQDLESDILLADIIAVAAAPNGNVASKLQKLSADLHLPFRVFEQLDSAEATRWVTELLLSRARDAWIDSAEALKSAAILRQDLDMQQHAFESLERAMLELGMSNFSLALKLQPTMNRLVLTNEPISPADLAGSPWQPRNCDACLGTMTQQLPISARRIAAVDLHCELLGDPTAAGTLRINISDVAGNSLSEDIEIKHSDLSVGWNRFLLPKVIDCSDRDAQLNLGTSGGGAVAISLAPCVPIKRFIPRNQEGIPLGNSPVATKVWRGFAGTRTKLPSANTSGKTHLRRRAEEMPKACLHSTGDPEMGFDPVQYWQKEDAFLVHPPVRGMTIGILEGLDCQHLTSITAIVHNGHREGPPISFAIGIVPNGQLLNASEILESWLTLPPLAWGEVHAFLPKPASGKFDVLLATLVAGGDRNHMAWGLFRGFLLNTEPS